MWLHKGIKDKQPVEMLKGVLAVSIITVCLVLVYWYGSIVHDLVNLSEAIS